MKTKAILKGKKGFTLTELMIVVLILGILVLIAVPIYKNITADAELNACLTNIRTVESAIVQFAAKESVKISDISGVNFTTGKVTVTVGGTSTDYDLLGDYLNEMPDCPDAAGTYTYDAGSNQATVYCNVHKPAPAGP
jgi:prepilin-type N-terminal cleavage/methylation domain-containing protein